MATITTPIYSASIDATVSTSIAVVSATSIDPVYSSTIEVTVASVIGLALAEFDPPTFSANLNALIAAALADVQATFTLFAPLIALDPWSKNLWEVFVKLRTFDFGLSSG